MSVRRKRHTDCSPPIFARDLSPKLRRVLRELAADAECDAGCYRNDDGSEMHLFSCRNHLLRCGLPEGK